jgi:hypothetical protein
VVVKPYTLPDGRVIKIGQERFQCAEVRSDLKKASEIGFRFRK